MLTAGEEGASLAQRHAVVLGLKAFVLSTPYDVPRESPFFCFVLGGLPCAARLPAARRPVALQIGGAHLHGNRLSLTCVLSTHNLFIVLVRSLAARRAHGAGAPRLRAAAAQVRCCFLLDELLLRLCCYLLRQRWAAGLPPLGLRPAGLPWAACNCCSDVAMQRAAHTGAANCQYVRCSACSSLPVSR